MPFRALAIARPARPSPPTRPGRQPLKPAGTRLAVWGALALLRLGAIDPAAAQIDLSPAKWPPGELERVARAAGPTGLVAHSRAIIAGTTNPLAVRAGREALARGGSAADAAITTALVQVVLAAGSYVSFAGFMNLVYYDAETRQVQTLNASYNTLLDERDPRSIPHADSSNGRTVLVPGFFAGIEAAHRRFGRLPFATLFGPAIYFAAEGFPLPPSLAGMIRFRERVFDRSPAAKAIFRKPDGAGYAVGETFRQPAVAATLRAVASNGSAHIYRGPWADRFVAAVRQAGGRISREDLRRYRPLWASSLATSYHGHAVHTMPLPNVGGGHLLQGLNLLEASGLTRGPHYRSSATALFQFTKISRVARLVGTQAGGAPTDSALLRRYLPGVDLRPAARTDKATATGIWTAMQRPEWRELEAAAFADGKRNSPELDSFLRDFVHSDGIVAADERGNVAVLLHTINTTLWGTTGLFVDGISIPNSASFQQRLIEAVGPGQRLPDPTMPLIVLRDGQPVLASNSVGGTGILANTLESLTNVLDYGMDVRAAVDTAQFLGPAIATAEADHQVLVQGDFPAALIDSARALGQAYQEVAPAGQGLARGYWVAVALAPERTPRRLTGAVSRILSGFVDGY
jgi:gamma-glutamyltranspeptidase/glutathione hydrolase